MIASPWRSWTLLLWQLTSIHVYYQFMNMKCRRIWQVPHAKEIIACVASSDNSIHTVIRISSLCSPTVPLILFQQMPWEAAKPTTQKWSWKKKKPALQTQLHKWRTSLEETFFSSSFSWRWRPLKVWLFHTKPSSSRCWWWAVPVSQTCSTTDRQNHF